MVSGAKLAKKVGFHHVAVRIVFTVLFAAAGWKAFHYWVALQTAGVDPEAADLQEALTWAPDWSEFYYRLGTLQRDDPDHLDPAAACGDFEKAVQLNPRNWFYWRELAAAYEVAGRVADAETAMKKVLELNPRSGVDHWALGNFYLRYGDLPRALTQIRESVRLDSKYRGPALLLLWKSGVTAQDLDPWWPKDRESRLMLVRFLTARKGDPGFLRAQWAALVSDNTRPIRLDEASFYLQYLWEEKRWWELREQWSTVHDLNKSPDVAFRKGENFVWNGSFTSEISRGILDWQLPVSPGFTIVSAEGEGADQSRALRIDFRGTENLDFALTQQLVVRPNQSYRFSFFARSEEISTEQGLYFQIVDGASGAVPLETAPILGTTPWQQYDAAFAVSAATEVLSLQLRRRPSRRIDNRLTGTFWLDSVVVSQLAP